MLGRRLDRHLLRSFLMPFVSCAAGLALLVVIFDILEEADNVFPFVFAKGGSVLEALRAVAVYYGWQALTFLASFGGLACLAGAALTVAALARNGELTAARAAGVSLRRALLPLLIFAALCGLAQLVTIEGPLRRLTPAATRANDAIHGRTGGTKRDVRLTDTARLAVWEHAEPAAGEEPIWKGQAQVSWRSERLLADGRTLEPLRVEIPRNDSANPYCVRADRARWRGGWWELTNGLFFDYSKGRGEEPATRRCERLTCNVTPVKLTASASGLTGLSRRELYELRNDPGARTELWLRATLPLVNLVLLLVGLPLAAAGGARGGRVLPLGAALVLGALYILAVRLGQEAAGSAGMLKLLEIFAGGDWLRAMGGPLRLAVDLAMALPHAAFLLLGGVLYWKMDR